ncbi:MAG TPA: S41 family peptidase [Salinimicrobium sp.]|nr:S41 family peptidase [Salinimicrobium sp.]
MKSSAKIYIPLLISLACAFGIFLGSRLNFNDSESIFTSNPTKEKLNKFIDYIDYEYVDYVNTDSIVDVTINNILANLDPHSVYLPEEEYVRVSENMQGDFVGIGVSFYMVNDTVIIIRAMEGGPSEKLGIKGGDRILSANGHKISGDSLDEAKVMELLKGEEETKVNLKIHRKTEDKILEFEVERGHVPLKSVDAAYMISDSLGYIKVNRFAETTYEEFRPALLQLKKEGATELILDLRNNPGGYLSEAVQMADDFLKEDLLILFTKNKSGAIQKTFAESDGLFEGKQVYVLINENSASASEIVAGALQDNDVGTIIGRRSYGKGLVQREMDLGDGSAIRLTIARYYTPTGRSIQKPYENGNEAYFNDYLHRYENGELQNVDSISVNDSLRYETPGGKIVYGGGGIIPDVFIPKDTDFEKENLDLILRSGFLDRFIFDLLEKDREYYQGFSLQEFNDSNLIDETIVKSFHDYMESLDFELRIVHKRDLLRRYLKATMAQQLFGSNASEKILNEEDKMIEKIIELSKGENPQP